MKVFLFAFFLVTPKCGLSSVLILLWIRIYSNSIKYDVAWIFRLCIPCLWTAIGHVYNDHRSWPNPCYHLSSGRILVALFTFDIVTCVVHFSATERIYRDWNDYFDFHSGKFFNSILIHFCSFYSSSFLFVLSVSNVLWNPNIN